MGRSSVDCSGRGEQKYVQLSDWAGGYGKPAQELFLAEAEDASCRWCVLSGNREDAGKKRVPILLAGQPFAFNSSRDFNWDHGLRAAGMGIYLPYKQAQGIIDADEMGCALLVELLAKQ